MKRPAARAQHDLGAEIPHRSLICCAAVQSVVRLTNARNVQLHLSYNGMGNSEAEVEITGAFNTTVHLSFQVPPYLHCLLISVDVKQCNVMT